MPTAVQRKLDLFQQHKEHRVAKVFLVQQLLKVVLDHKDVRVGWVFREDKEGREFLVLLLIKVLLDMVFKEDRENRVSGVFKVSRVSLVPLLTKVELDHKVVKDLEVLVVP